MADSISIYREQVTEARKITAQLNTGYHTPEEVHILVSELIGKPVDPSVDFALPLYVDFGKNITLGKNVFINSGCCFQDQGGITIGDGTLIGHHTAFATINHDYDPDKRRILRTAPIVIGKNVWIGSNVSIVPGVTIHDGAIIGAGSVVTKDIPENTIAAGVPAKVIRQIR